MPKRTKDAEPDGGDIHEAIRENGISEKKLKSFVKRAENEMGEIEKIMADAKAACQPHVDEIKVIKKEAATAGIPKKVFSVKLRERSFLRRAEDAPSILSDEQLAIFNEISEKLGPLGAWAKRDAETAA